MGRLKEGSNHHLSPPVAEGRHRSESDLSEPEGDAKTEKVGLAAYVRKSLFLSPFAKCSRKEERAF